MKANTHAEFGCFLSLHPITLLFLVFLSFIISVNSVYSAQLTVAWDPNNDEMTAGYKIYYGTESNTYDSSIDVGSATQYLIADLKAGTIYYFAAKAYDANGTESDFSEEIGANTPSEPTVTPTPDPMLDSDHDGITDVDETTLYGTDPQNPDTDGDGLTDGQELQLWGSNWQGDDDGDGIINLLDAEPAPQEPVPGKKRVNMGPIYSLLLD